MNRTKAIFLFLSLIAGTLLLIFEWGWGFSHQLDGSSVLVKARKNPIGYTFDFHSEVPIGVQIFATGGTLVEATSSPYLWWHCARIEVKTGAIYAHAEDLLDFRRPHRELIPEVEYELVGNWKVRTFRKADSR